MNDLPIAIIRNSNIYYIYTDHLNTPRAITDTSNNLKWSWENKEAFGNNQPDENVSGTQFSFNFRFPGQYFDIETGLNYNINRDYNPVWGRYMTSNPLGLSAGLNTYGYAGANSLTAFDKLGLLTEVIVVIDKEGIDHAALRIDNQVLNFHPGVNKGLALDSIRSVASITSPTLNEFHSKYSKNKRHHLKLRLTKEEENNILAFFHMQKNKNLKYSLIGTQCVGFTLDLLSVIGINENVYFPSDLISVIKNNNRYISERIFTPNTFYGEIE